MNKKNITAYVCILIVFILSGCHQHVRPLSREIIGSERVFQKSYTRGQTLAAYVGQPIVKVKDYKVKRFKAKYMRASDDFMISGGPIAISGDKNTNYTVRGETTIDAKTYTVLNLPGSKIGEGFGALINSDGSVHSQLINGTVIMVYTFKAFPLGLRFISSKDEEIDKTAGYLNYELIYSGTDGKSITITYREYTIEDLARPAFYQNVVYEASSEMIRFRDTVIQVHQVTSEKIVFTVISDNL